MKRASLRDILDKNGIMVIDGAMSTALEELGASVNHKLWTANVLAKRPELVKQVHLNYFKAGADCGITCSYQATIQGFLENGYTLGEAEELIQNSVRLFLEARDEWWKEAEAKEGRSYPLCLGAVGPYGAYLADGSEYTGSYDIKDDALYDFHKRRMELLWEAGADMLIVETQPSFREALIEAEIAEELSADYWISFSCRDGYRINDGTPIKKCAEALSKNHPRLKMIGINCTRPEFGGSLIRELKASTDLPIAIYPNSGKVYDPKTKTWTSKGNARTLGDYALDYMREGASAVGGCCTTAEDDIRQVAKARDSFLSMGRPKNLSLKIHKE